MVSNLGRHPLLIGVGSRGGLVKAKERGVVGMVSGGMAGIKVEIGTATEEDGKVCCL